MVLLINEQITTKIQVLNASGSPVTTATVNYIVYDEANNVFANGVMIHFAKGIYTATWTPDAVGEWTFECECNNPKFYRALTYSVSKGIEKSISDKLDTVDNLIDLIKVKTDTILWSDIMTIDTIVDAIKAKTDTIVWGDITDIESKIDTVDTVVDAIKVKTDNLPSDPASETNVDAVEAKVDTVDTVVDAVKAKTDNLPTDPASQAKIVSHMDFWSENDDDITITNAHTNINLPNIVVAGLPTGVTLIRAIVMLKIALIRDSSGSDNAIDETAMVVQIDADNGFANPITAIDIKDNSWSVDVSTSPDRGGDVEIGDNDVKAELNANPNATYYLRLYNAEADGNNLLLKDVKVGLRIYFS